MRSILPEICTAVWGAEYVELCADGLHVHRFNAGESMLYRQRRETFFMKSRASAGITLHFRTDSEKIFLAVAVKPGSSRKYFSMEVLSDGLPVGGLQNFDRDKMTGRDRYCDIEGPWEPLSAEFMLPEGDREIEIVLPWSAETVLTELRIGKHASLQPVLPKKSFLFYGDSITQGYDALYPSARYAAQVCRAFRAAEYNKAIGGEIFFPELAAEPSKLLPDAVFVAYGTNDWFRCDETQFVENCGKFFENLCNKYPDRPIFALTPIWRGDRDTPRPMGAHARVGELIRILTGRYRNVTVVDGADFLPAEPTLFADGFLHPNDRGFTCFADRLLEELKKTARFTEARENHDA